jgi:PAS domain S-box-containing protein
MSPKRILDENGQYTGLRGNNLDIAERKDIEHVITVQRDLALALDRAPSLQESLQLCLKAVIEASGLDAGGIYILDKVSGNLNLIFYRGLSPEFAKSNSESAAKSQRTKMVLAGGQPLYLNSRDIGGLQSDDISREGIRSLAVVPFSDKGQIIGCLNVASRMHSEIPASSRYTLESIARQIGAAVARAQTGQDLMTSEEKYRAIFENAVEGIFQTTPRGRILSVNPAMARLFGYKTPADFMQSITNIVQLYANPDARLFFRREMEEKDMVNKYEVPCVRKDGEEILVAVNARAIKDIEGNIIRYDGFYEDITQQKKIENSLKESEGRYRMIVENMHDIIWVMDLNFRYKYRSPSNVEITGRTPAEIMTRPPREQIVPESYALVEKILAEELVNEFGGKPVDPRRSRTLELEVYHKNGGTVWIEVTASFGRDENGKPVEILLAGRDITERKRMQKENDNLEKQLIQAQKMEAIGTLAGGIAHDFNNILASLMGFTEMAGRETRQDVRRDYLDQVLQACERAKNLVSQILVFSRQREQESKPVDIRLIIKEALTLLRATLPTTIDMQQEITGEQTTVLADPTQIHQIVMNLCTNAAQAMTGKSGVLDVHLSNITIGAAGQALHPDLQPGPYVQLSVRDTGCGIDPAIRDRIFDPFFTTKKTKQGTGLGLSVVYGIVKSYGGAIDVQSSAGEGTTFTI